MGYASSSLASQIKCVVFLCLLLISKLNGVPAKLMLNNAPQMKYDVFVNFRGDIRQGFLSHLIEAFSQKQIYAFVDDKIETGNEISPSLGRAIEESFISLIIFSGDYASSRWCLEELVIILECKEKHGQIVIPVFYYVEPTTVRHQKGSYNTSLIQLEKKYNVTKVQVQVWRDALNTAANLSGIKSSDFRNDAELLKRIVNLILRELHKHPINSKGLIGVSKSIADIESLLHQETKDVRAIGIWGMGGIGKTTIAEEVFNKLRSKYEGCCFLANVREESGRHGMTSLKEKLFSTLLAEDVKFTTPDELSNYIERRIDHKKVLIVLDDVNDSNQIEKLLGTLSWFASGSRIIVTTRDKQVLVANNVDDIYQVEALSFHEAFELFSLITFNQRHDEMEYYELTKRVVSYAKGIPLVIKVFGHLLHGKDKEVWESHLDKLKKMPMKRVYDVMRLSYDDLDRIEQKIFLDIACFFNGLNLKLGYMKNLLKDCESDNSVVVGLESLKDKALITISEDNVVSMHDIIQEMGWEVARDQSSGKLGRLWDPDDVYEVLKNDKGTEAVRSIKIHLSQLKNLKLSPHIFTKMSKLRFLDFQTELNPLYYWDLPQGLQSMPDELRFLRWVRYPLKSLPKDFSAEKLVVLDLPHNNLEKLWDGVKNLPNLKEVILDHSRFLPELPNFSKAPNLELLECRFFFSVK